MPRQNRTSRMLEKAEIRIAGLKAIDPQLDFGDSHTITYFSDLIEQLRTKLDAHNTALAVVDSSRTEIEMLEKTVGELAEKMLLGVAFKYGKDSREYEMAGGVRKSDRIRKSINSRIKANAEGTGEKSLTA
ncbi:hypothetical protein K9N68_25635 [Kovacikia minuta CCNUW1]|uniref:hypothetical protein n=1 Tax=Kovacikia minuta TaxID=2931930 RepID=UPI001CCFBF01|nr:hypothetical protein [Kovacikia minuta]UBF24993.1 hypothetical protein K9N68_25635 [Kovacikia minuta CCNUW1]